MAHLQGREERDLAESNRKLQITVPRCLEAAAALSALLARLYRLYKKDWSRLQARAWKRDAAGKGGRRGAG